MEITAQIFRRSVEVSVTGSPDDADVPHSRGDRAAIDGFSLSSRRRLVRTIYDQPFPEGECTQFALTFHDYYPMDGQALKKMLNLFLTHLRKKFPNFKYLWVLEFQRRGAPHFHFFIDRSFDNQDFRDYVARLWCDCTGGGTREMYEYHRDYRNFIDWILSPGYAVKYLSKGYQKQVPERFSSVGRFWGCSRDFRGLSYSIVSDLLPDSIADLRQRVFSLLRFFRRYLRASWRAGRPKYRAFVSCGGYLRISLDGLISLLDFVQLPYSYISYIPPF